MVKVVFLCIGLVGWLGAQSLESKIGQMLMVGFHGTSASKGSQICNDIARYNIGAVILFDYNPVNKNKPKNIASKSQVARLTEQLQACSNDSKLLIAVDQEGGKVQRLKQKYGFYGKYPKASSISSMNKSQVFAAYKGMAKELKLVGINFNLAPVVDLAINPKNHVINGLGRSFGKKPTIVAGHASTFIDAMHEYGVLTSLKHFPGHGSSVGDTHKGYVDVTNLWQERELEPYKLLASKADTVMVAHVFNKNIDSSRPASLSYATIDRLLRGKLDFDGVVITDDLQMGAISQKYTLQETLTHAVGAGNDLLIFGNQLDPSKVVSASKLVSTISNLVKQDKIDVSRIEKSYNRIQKLKQKL